MTDNGIDLLLLLPHMVRDRSQNGSVRQAMEAVFSQRHGGIVLDLGNRVGVYFGFNRLVKQRVEQKDRGRVGEGGEGGFDGENGGMVVQGGEL